MTATVRIAVEESSQIAEARRIARRHAEEIGFDETRAERVAIVVTEAGTNILKHAGRGEILVNPMAGGSGRPHPGLEILALDRGPGIENLEKCIRNGYSTGGSPGHGLGAIFRLAGFADIYTAVGKGTGMIARWMVSPDPAGDRRRALAIGAVNVPKGGETYCGDSWEGVEGRGHTTVLAADGLGHGYEASIAAREAVRMLCEHAELEPVPLLELTHQALQSSRGAAVAVARIDAARGKLSYAGVGNITAQIYSGAQPQQHLVSVNGTAGHQAQRFREFSYPWPDNGVLIVHSDGLQSATGLEGHSGLVLHDPSLIAGVLYRDYSRGRDDATVIVVKDA